MKGSNSVTRCSTKSLKARIAGAPEVLSPTLHPTTISTKHGGGGNGGGGGDGRGGGGGSVRLCIALV